MNLFSSKLYRAWSGSPPNIMSISQSMPNTPWVPLSGGGAACMPLNKFLENLERDMKTQSGDYYAYVKNSDGNEEDTYVLQGWQVCRPDDGFFEAVVILYYAALNPYMTLKKYIGEDIAQEYLDEMNVRSRLASLISD